VGEICGGGGGGISRGDEWRAEVGGMGDGVGEGEGAGVGVGVGNRVRVGLIPGYKRESI